MISIIITAYNVAPWIEQAIYSACRQSYNNIEIIVVEDCSTDSTREILSRIKEEQVRIIYNDINIGAGASRRKGIEAAKGEYLLLLDGDDWIDHNFVETLYNCAQEHDADIVSGGIKIIGNDGSWEGTSYGNLVVEGKEKIAKFWGEKVIFMNNKLIRRSLHEKVPYCTRRFIEDTSVIIPQLFFANKVVYTDNIGYNYRMRPDSLTHSATRFKHALFRALCAADLIRFFENQDKEMLAEISLGEGYAGCINEIKECHPDRKMIALYINEWVEFTTGLMERIA